jgi:hypothetical protein
VLNRALLAYLGNPHELTSLTQLVEAGRGFSPAWASAATVHGLSWRRAGIRSRETMAFARRVAATSAVPAAPRGSRVVAWWFPPQVVDQAVLVAR